MELAVDDFSLDKTLNAGQTFSWQKIKDEWISCIDKPIILRQNGDKIECSGGSEEEVKKRLGLGDDIKSIRAELDKDDFLDKAIEYSGTLRVVNDGLWPTTLGFILSIQSNIPLILRRISSLSRTYGHESDLGDKTFYSFPGYAEIKDGGPESLKDLKLGFRTKFVLSAAEYFYEHNLSESLGIDDIKTHLLNIKGVGEKVLDCILLYGLHDLSAFPMDVWMSRILAKEYNHMLKGTKNYKSKRQVMVDYFGKYAGYAQLFIYNYSRLNKLK